ncbi:MAG: hypothetical protein ACYDHZ_11185 [Dehalococcoidia bacterium]
METDVAPVTFHDSVEELPEVMLFGVRVKLPTAGSTAGVTVSVVAVVDGPALLVAVSV